jgi:hypothetical protein
VIRAGSMVARVAALGLLAGFAAALWAGPVAIYREALDASHTRVAQASALAARYRLLAAGSPDGAVPRAASGLLLADLPAAQSFAALSETIKQAADAAGLAVQGLQGLGEESVLGLQRSGVRVRGTATLAGLARFLATVEGGMPLLIVDGLRVQSRQGTGATQEERLEIQMDIVGFREPT